MEQSHFDLFSGIGGFLLAAQWANFNSVGWCELDGFCREVLLKNFPHAQGHINIKLLEKIPHVSLLTGGFPCQGFSIAGKQKGVHDERYLWPEMFRLIKQSHPHWVVGENVPGIIPLALDQVISNLESENYEVVTMVLPACAAGAPHRRDRVWIIAHRMCKRCYSRFDLNAEGTDFRDLKWNLAATQKRWKNLQYESWETFNFKNWFESTPDSNVQQRSTQSENTKTFTERFKRTLDIGKVIPDSTPFKKQEGQPPIPGVDDGLSDIVDRNKALGNAIVPQTVYPILQFISDIETVLTKGT